MLGRTRGASRSRRWAPLARSSRWSPAWPVRSGSRQRPIDVHRHPWTGASAYRPAFSPVSPSVPSRIHSSRSTPTPKRSESPSTWIRNSLPSLGSGISRRDRRGAGPPLPAAREPSSWRVAQGPFAVALVPPGEGSTAKGDRRRRRSSHATPRPLAMGRQTGRTVARRRSGILEESGRLRILEERFLSTRAWPASHSEPPTCWRLTRLELDS